MLFKIIETISTASGWIAGIGVVVMAVVITIDVFLRYFWGKPLLFADDVSVYCMMFVTFVGAALTLKMRRHIMVDLFYKMVSRKAQLWLDAVTTIAGCFVVWFLLWHTIGWVQYNYQTGYMSAGVLQTPMWIPMSIIPIGLFFFALQYLVECVKVVKALQNQQSNAKEGPAHA
jgi:C4-dicarboxylate transporter DctQ subunit